MPLFSLDIEKELGGEFWTNRYILELDDITQAVLAGNTITGFELAIHYDIVNFTKYRVSDLNPETDVYVIVPIGAAGERTFVGSYLPLFNVVRVDFPAGTGRPSRKYLRLPINENEVDNGVLASGLIALINSEYGVPLGDFELFVDVDGQPIGTGIVSPKVAMRQLRRGSRRKVTPVIPTP